MPITNWDDLRIFVAVGRAGGIAAAARALRIDHSTVVRRLAGLEEAMGVRLADRLPTGVKLTSVGSELFAHAERIEAEAMAADFKLSGVEAGPAGTVRLATPEAFGSFLVAPNLSLLHARYPGICLELVPEGRAVSLSRREADIGVMLARPPRGRFHARKLVDYGLGLFGSADYLQRTGQVRQTGDLQRHAFVSYIDDLVGIPQLRALEQIVPNANIVFRSSSIVAQHNAVASGLGVGLLHIFEASRDPQLVPILPDQIVVPRSYWLVVNSEQRGLPRIAAVLGFLDEIVALNRNRMLPHHVGEAPARRETST